MALMLLSKRVFADSMCRVLMSSVIPGESSFDISAHGVCRTSDIIIYRKGITVR